MKVKLFLSALRYLPIGTQSSEVAGTCSHEEAFFFFFFFFFFF